MGQGDQIREHQAGVIRPADFPQFPFRELNLSQCGNWRSQNVAMGQKLPRSLGAVVPAAPRKAAATIAERGGS